jgi:hypothetical protein
LAEARQLFAEEGLPFPPIPEDLAPRVVKIGPWVYGTRADIPNLYRFELFVTEVESEDVPDYVVFGHAGHGFNSWAIHHYLVHGPLALLLQLAYGGAMMDNRQMAQDMARAFAVAGDLIRAAEDAVAAGRQLPGRLTVAASNFYGSRWTWLEGKGEDRQPKGIDWNESGTVLDALSDAAEALQATAT